MGRRLLKAEERRSLLSARFDPSVRHQIQAQAEANGRSAAAEIEARVRATIALDAVGLELVERIGSEISALNRRNQGKRWHKDLTTWAATAEMMAIGPIQDLKPMNPVDADVQEAAQQPLHEIYYKQDALVWKLGQLGVTVARTRTIGGLLRLNSRDLERAGIDKISASQDRDQAIAVHEMLISLDDAHDQALLRYKEAMEPYEKAEEQGRELYRDHLTSEAARAQAEGRPFNWLHLLRIFPTWR